MKQRSELFKRVITGVIGGAGLLALIVFGGRIGTCLLAAILSLGMMREFVTISFGLTDKREKRNLLLGTTWLIAFVNALIPREEYTIFVVAFLGLFTYFLFTAGRHKDAGFSDHFKELMFSVFGLMYVAFLPLYLPLIRDSANGLHWTIVFLIIVWSGDTGAYFAGKKFGKRKLYPLISPKKTVEGGIGGLVAGILLALVYKLAAFNAMSWQAIVLIPIVIGVIAPIGDLGESYFKRAFNVKDSGSILPGHGGFLDRFDGVVFSLPVMYACVRLFS